MATMNILHVTLSLTVNDVSYNWRDPQGRTSLEFSLPVQLFDATSFSKLIKEQVTATEKDYAVVLEKARLDAEAEALAQAKAEAEAG